MTSAYSGEFADKASVEARIAAERLSDLTYEERKVVECALLNHDFVSLPTVVRQAMKTATLGRKAKHTVEVAMGRAAARLYNRGLAALEKAEDGMIWIS
ncbi:MAG: hypothetical protein LBS92_04930 [Candidatus Methanoplasma sp.]|jgi:hypothetical protein|nr:hypothetical protein [Candidatus Methanoplasma sp.]